MTQPESDGDRNTPREGQHTPARGDGAETPGSGGAASGSGVAPPTVLDAVASLVPGGALLAEAVEVDPESLRAAGSGAERIAEKLDALLREQGGPLDACTDRHPTWETSSALRRCGDAARERIRRQAKDVADLGDRLKRVGTGYTDAEKWAEDTLRRIAKRLEDL